MRDYLLDDDHRRLRDELRDFIARELSTRAERIESHSDWSALRDSFTAAGRAGHLAYLLPGDDAGPVSLVKATMFAEEAAAVSYAFEATVGSSLSCAVPLRRHATADVRSRWLSPLSSGDAVGAICITEPGVGSDSAGMTTRVVVDEASGEVVIDGFKRFISNAGVADVYIVYGISDPAVAAQRGMTAVVVPADAPGLSVPRQYTLIGRRGCVVGEVALDGVRVETNHLLGRPGDGFQIMVGMFNLERILLGGAGLGVARAAFDVAREHAVRRESFGQPLGAKQLIWGRLAELSWRIDAAELLTYRAARLYDDGCDPKALMREAAMAKLVATETAVACSDACVQILGGEGLVAEFSRAEQLYRDARAMPIVGGTSEMAKYVIASRDMPDLRLSL